MEYGRIDRLNRELTPEEHAQIARDIAQEVREARIARKLDKVRLRAVQAAEREGKERRAHESAERMRKWRERSPVMARIQQERDEITRKRAVLDQLQAEANRRLAAKEKQGRARWN
ncbi:hypothetical protein [Nocardia brasiliensis]|uniref:hypothetical protein n=1 Tax=Nocardia brasiliensis TaxID=37326 RepID=UPI0024559510|nr:hypothetical protein [Nocardia brasiliensis]